MAVELGRPATTVACEECGGKRLGSSFAKVGGLEVPVCASCRKSRPHSRSTPTIFVGSVRDHLIFEALARLGREGSVKDVFALIQEADGLGVVMNRLPGIHWVRGRLRILTGRGLLLRRAHEGKYLYRIASSSQDESELTL